MKKILSTLLAIACALIMISASFPTFAEDAAPESETFITNEDTSLSDDSEEPPEETEQPAITKKETVGINDGYDRLIEQFTVKKSDCGMKYAYYSPVADENDATKYPLVIYVHGRFHGWTDKTFVKSGLTYWCSTEIQEQFEAGGAHLLMPKLSEFMLSSTQSESVYSVIQEYISENRSSIDESNILIMGGSAGGGVAWKLMINHPELFSAGVALCSTKIPSTSELKKAANLPIWIISSKTDPLINFLLNQSITWNRLCSTTNVGEQCRWSVFNSRVTLPDGSHPFISHFLAKTIGYNLCRISDNSPLPDRTVNCMGEEINLLFDNSIIEWFEAA